MDFTLPQERQDLPEEHKTYLASRFHFNEIAAVRQVHGSRVFVIKETNKIGFDALEEADALVTDIPNLAISIRTADCLPAFICDPQSRTIGLVHAGWRGSQKGVLREAVQLMVKEMHASTAEMRVAFGPVIRSCCYQVGEEFSKYFPQEVTRYKNEYYLDLLKVNTQQLLNLGVREENILDSGICTCCDEEFFSYRREGKSAGRMISVMMLY